MRENNIAFADIKDSEGNSVAFSVTGYPGHQIDRSDRAGQVTLNISGYDGTTLLYDTVIDLELPLARVFACAVLEMANWAEAQDRDNWRRGMKP